MLPRLVRELECSVQLLEALLERVALVVLHQLLQGAHTHQLCHTPDDLLVQGVCGWGGREIHLPGPLGHHSSLLAQPWGWGRVVIVSKTSDPAATLPSISEGNNLQERGV
jgi:hypothetical protein